MDSGYLVVLPYNSNHDVPSHVYAKVCSPGVIRLKSRLDPDRLLSSLHFHTPSRPGPIRSRSLREVHSSQNPTRQTHHSP
jgi:hypothetical protein